MAYLKPQPLLAGVLNPLAMKFAPGRVATLVVAGRRSGVPHKVPLVVLDYDGRKYLVSARGEADWVKNLRQAGGGELIQGRSSRTVSASEVPVERRAQVIAAYRAKTGRSLTPLFHKLPEHKDHPVFEIS
ncbi:MAG: nitroreductase family deazaflavin-dependent oxidoreductase [Actinomycetota bacterium]|nr:nitroreductase family deazaflavin-dependent oxidoreductase [Actinomycetota bacterium]